MVTRIGYKDYSSSSRYPQGFPTAIKLSPAELATIKKYAPAKPDASMSELRHTNAQVELLRSADNRIEARMSTSDHCRPDLYSRASIDPKSGMVSIIGATDLEELTETEDAALNATVVKKQIFIQLLKDTAKLSPARAARMIWEYTRTRFRYKDNDQHVAPCDLDTRDTADCDDLAMYVHDLLSEISIEAQVIVIKNPPGYKGVPLHAACIYKIGGHWLWMDNDTFGTSRDTDPNKCAARIYKKPVQFYFIDHKEIWLRGGEDTDPAWIESPYR